MNNGQIKTIHNQDILEWKIERKETRRRTQKFIIAVLPVLILASLIYHFHYPAASVGLLLRRQFLEIFFTVPIAILAAFIILLVINKFYPYSRRRYVLTNQGLDISKNKKTKHYNWNEFECFLVNEVIAENNIAKAIGKLENIYIGKDFFLKKKERGILSKLRKTFVVIHSEPDDFETVRNFLARYIPERPKRIRDDLGLISYEFK